MCVEVLRHSDRIPRLHEHGPRACELAHQTLTGSEVANNTSGRDALEHVFAVPSDEVAVVDDVLLAFAELVQCQRPSARSGLIVTHVLPDDSTQTLDPDDTDTTEFVHEETFA